MDPLSNVLSLLKLRSYVSGGFDCGGDWSLAFGKHDGIKVYAAVSGACWLQVEGVPEPVHVQAGDCFLLPRGLPFRIASDLALTPVDAHGVFARNRTQGGIGVYNGGGAFFSVGGLFALSGDYVGTLCALLPPIVHLHDEADKAVLRWCVEGMRQELREPQPGGFLVAQQLAMMMLVQALRLHLAEGSASGTGWLFALADRQMAAAITAIHDAPARRWTLAALAQQAGMSRTSFAAKFKHTVGTAPMEYLMQWRMALARDRLAHSRDQVATIALAVGYESESAFGNAFKRVTGCSPRQFGRNGRVDAGSAPPSPSGGDESPQRIGVAG